MNPEKWHEGLALEAAQILAETELRIIESSAAKVKTLNPSLGRAYVPEEIIYALSPSRLSRREENRWRHDENWVFLFLNAAKRAIHPEITDQELISNRAPKLFPRVQDGLDYLRSAQSRLSTILRVSLTDDHDPLEVTLTSYDESRLLRMATYQNLFLARPAKNQHIGQPYFGS